VNAAFNSTGHGLTLPDIAFGDGVHVVDGDGKRYLDLTAGVWCISVGHQNVRVTGAIRRQLATLSHAGFNYSHPIVEEAAASLLSVCGMDDGGVVFLCSGSEAIDYARQAVKKITDRELSLAFHDAYLGSLSSVLDRSENWFIVDWENCASCAGGRRAADCDHFDDIPEEVSEFIFEPGSSEGRVRFAPIPIVRAVADIVKANGGKVIANEVTTGIGRTGAWFGHDHFGIRPDLIVDPLGAAVVKEVIAVIRDEGLIEQAAAHGKVFLEALQRLEAQPAVGDVRGRGLMFAVDLSDAATASTVYHALFDRGYIVCLRGATLRIDPPLTTPRPAFLEFVDAFEDTLEDT
jgi:acetylornithine aminotransferase